MKSRNDSGRRILVTSCTIFFLLPFLASWGVAAQGKIEGGGQVLPQSLQERAAEEKNDCAGLQPELDAARDELTSALSRIEELKAESAEKSSTAETRIQSLSRENQGLETKLTELSEARQQEAVRCKETVQQLEGSRKEARDLQERVQVLAEAKEKLEEQARAQRVSLGKTASEMEALRSFLPPQDGGSASMDMVGPRAKAVYERYVGLIMKKKSRPADWQEQRDKAGKELNAVQALAGRIFRAQGMAVVRPGQTLSTIAYQFYGKSDWERIYQANKHILDNPDLVVPGITLVIP